MPSSYVKEYQRKHKYGIRSCTYSIKRISEPIDQDFREYRSVRKMTEELKLSEPAIRAFYKKSDKDSMYIRSKVTDVLYMVIKPKKDIVCEARSAEFYNDAPDTQTFTSYYQLSKRFRISNATIAKLKKETPLGEVTKFPVNDEFKRKWFLIFYK